MRAFDYCLAVFITVLPAALMTTPASAQTLAVGWVSSTGANSNTCMREAPCETFLGAYNKTLSGGSIRCADSGDFGGLTISRSITIDCDAQEAASTSPFWVNAAGIRVVLRGVTIGSYDQGAGTYGVRIMQPSSVVLENVGLRGATLPIGGYGVIVENSSGTVELSINGSVMNANRIGIRVAPTGTGSAKVVVNESHVTDNGAGIQVDSTSTTGRIDVSITDTVLDGNTNSGLALSGGSPAGIYVNASRMSSVNNGGHGLRVVHPLANIRVAYSTITGNLVGVESINNGTIISYGNNNISRNGTNGSVSAVISMD